MSTTLTLVSHNLCPYVQRAAIALIEKGVPFDRVTIDLADKPAWFRSISPLGKVPLLMVAEEGKPEAVLFESAVICEYIEETQPGAKLHPADALERARHRAWIEFGSAILGELYGLETTRDASVFETKRSSIAARFERLEVAKEAGPYFGGEAFTLVDATYAPIFRYFDVFDGVADLRIFDTTPRVRAWREALAARPSVQAAAAPNYRELLMAFLHRHEAHMLSLAA